MLLRTMKKGDSIQVGEGIKVLIRQTSSGRVKIGICAPDDQVIRFSNGVQREPIQDERACPSSRHSEER